MIITYNHCNEKIKFMGWTKQSAEEGGKSSFAVVEV